MRFHLIKVDQNNLLYNNFVQDVTANNGNTTTGEDLEEILDLEDLLI